MFFRFFLDAMPSPIAHSGSPPQPLFESRDGVEAHAAAVACRAAEFAEAFGSERVAAWLGWWHDAGKVAPDVQAYLRGETALKQGPDHSSAGMLAAAELGPLWPLAFNVAGHHGGLQNDAALKDRVERKRKRPEEARVRDALATARPLLARLAPAISVGDLPRFAATDKLSFELWLRMLHSVLVDADWLDTEAFLDPESAGARREHGDSLAPLWATLRDSQDALIRDSDPTPVNVARAEIYRACLDAAARPQGVFSLTVPTGGGKTLSSMAFALKHAQAHGLRRVVVALPYTSIIEQNAERYREVFGADAVLEHHSARPLPQTPAEEDAELPARLAAENWDAPVVVTTTVQLLESLFANRNPRLRKLHRLAGSVVILDEAQTLPPHLLKPTLDVLRALVRDYGVTLVLSTATPPALAARDGFPGFDAVVPIINDPDALADHLRRVRFDDQTDEPWSWERTADEVQAQRQVLCIVNTKPNAQDLLDLLPDNVLHLSTALCPAHRRSVLAEVYRRLDAGEPCRLVSTQVVEAGVDLDFPVVMRAVGPLDRIVQAAGRCNREGRLRGADGEPALGRVVVFRPQEGGLPPGAYKLGTQETEAMLASDPDLDLAAPATCLDYFRRLYGLSSLDRDGVQAFRRALRFADTADAYRLIEDDQVAVVVDYDGGHALLAEVARKPFPSRHDRRALQAVSVSLRQRDVDRALREGAAVEVGDGLVRWDRAYDARRGLTWDIPFLRQTVV